VTCVNDTSVFERFHAAATRWPDKPFLNILPETAGIYGVAPGEISYATMLGRVMARQGALAAAGFGEGTRVGLLLQNRPEFIELWFASNSLGASVVPINPDLRRGERRPAVVEQDEQTERHRGAQQVQRDQPGGGVVPQHAQEQHDDRVHDPAADAEDQL
jgi:acyl-CoA synthetase (AMP-forming)/AMP-acid ligase II